MNEENKTEVTIPDELTLLKERADTMGVVYHPNIGIKKLKAKLEEKMSGVVEDPTEAAEEMDTIDSSQVVAKANIFTPGVKETPAQLKAKRKQDALSMVRIRVTCMNPIKGNMKGDIVCVGNSELGMIKKFVPFNAEQGWHVPNIILQEMKAKRYMSHYEVKIGNKKIKRNKLVPEYAIEIMAPLTSKEMNELKQRQIIANTGG